MNFAEATLNAKPLEDHEGNDYLRDESGFGVRMNGYYTVEELQVKVAQLQDANLHYSTQPITSKEQFLNILRAFAPVQPCAIRRMKEVNNQQNNQNLFAACDELGISYR
jgi:hypothetical protein